VTITKDHLDLIGQIYDIPSQPDKWQHVLDRFAPLVGAAGAGVMTYDPLYAEHNANIVTSNYTDIDPNFIEHFAEFSRQEQAGYALMAENPQRGFVSDFEAMGISPGDAHANLPAVRWLTDNFNIRHRAVSCLNLERVWTDMLAIQFKADRGPLNEAERSLGNLFLPHFAKAVEIGRMFGVLEHRYKSIFSALNRLNIGVLILSATGDVLIKNTEAERILESDDALRLTREGRLTFPLNDALNATIKQVSDTAQGNSSSPGRIFSLRRRSSETPCLVEISPMRGGDLGPAYKGSVVFVIDPTQTQNISTEGMQTIFRLTGAESDICRMLAEGFRPSDIADSRNVSEGTVRSQIRSLFEKTKTNSQLDIVRLALKVNLPIK